MDPDAIIWTEGKTDWQHIKHAVQVLGAGGRIGFQESDSDMGDDQLVRQCVALSRVPQVRPTVFIFDRDNNEVVKKVEEPCGAYKCWGNNVYSFAIPTPVHRNNQGGVCIELYYSDDELKTPDPMGRRLYLSTEFNPVSGRHHSDPRLSVGQKSRLSGAGSVRILDSEVYDDRSQNVALSKVDFANSVALAVGAFAEVKVESFREILAILDTIIDQASLKHDLVFGDLADFLKSLEKLEKPQRLGAIVESAIQVCKLIGLVFVGTTVRHYEQRITEGAGRDARKVRSIKQVLANSFGQPSLATLQKLAVQCYHLIDDRAPSELCTLRQIMAANPLLGPLGELLDQVDRMFPLGRREVRVLNKARLQRPVLEYLLQEFASYEGRITEIAEIASETDALKEADPEQWHRALSMLGELFAPVRSLTFRVRNIQRVRNYSDEFDVLLTTYGHGRVVLEELTQTLTDLKDDRLETYELVLAGETDHGFLDVFPFLVIKDHRLHYYGRTRSQGYEYSRPFSTKSYVEPTKRKFSHFALRAESLIDLQGFFWTPVSPSVSPAGVKANIPFHEPFVGRKQQLTTLLEEVIQIPNQNGILYGPGGVGKTALLIELSRQLFEDGTKGTLVFQNIIWVSAKRTHYDPRLDEVGRADAQFSTLDNVLAAILEFHEWEDSGGYNLAEKKWLVCEHLRDERTLLVLDNFESVSPIGQQDIIRFFGIEVKQALRDKPDYCKVLITSRELVPSGFHQISLKGLDKRESFELMRRLHELYVRSGRPNLTEQEREALHEATRGIPLILKHCYGQVYEFNRLVDPVIRGLSAAGAKVVDFSFEEMFSILKRDSLQLRTLLLLELVGKPLMQRQIADMLDVTEMAVGVSLSQLVRFQCATRSTTSLDGKLSVSDEVRIFTRRLAQEHAHLAVEIKRRIASLAIEKRMDYSKEEMDALLVFQDYIGQGHYVLAEDFIKERLKQQPRSLLFNLYYATYLREIKHRTQEAIELLERIREPSGNDPQILRLLMTSNASLDIPNFEQAHAYARELEGLAVSNADIRLELARFYVAWSTATKMKRELDPLHEMLRQQKYKELADMAIGFLKGCAQTHEWHHLMAQSHYNRWVYDLALRHVEEAIAGLPKDSHLRGPYRRLKGEILKKREFFDKRPRGKK